MHKSYMFEKEYQNMMAIGKPYKQFHYNMEPILHKEQHLDLELGKDHQQERSY